MLLEASEVDKLASTVGTLMVHVTGSIVRISVLVKELVLIWTQLHMPLQTIDEVELFPTA